VKFKWKSVLRCVKQSHGFDNDRNFSGIPLYLTKNLPSCSLRAYSEALAFLSQSRQTVLLNAFTNALTRGGSGGLPRPIELHAHDPMRYVGDMLAWIHQTIAAEREFLESLFDMKSDMRMVGSIRKFGGNEEEEWIQELMDAALSKVSVPLKVRVQQTIRSQESSIVSFKIANLLQFYTLTMERTIGEDALLSKTLHELVPSVG
jgi:conserved oligomeric Golgi complex subunit 6